MDSADIGRVKGKLDILNYLGLTVAGFPNLFMIHGSGSPGVFYNMPLGAERQLDWIGHCIGHSQKQGMGAVEPTTDGEEAWGNEVNGIANATLFPRTDSWWTGANIPGEPRHSDPISLCYPEQSQRHGELLSSYFRFRAPSAGFVRWIREKATRRLSLRNALVRVGTCATLVGFGWMWGGTAFAVEPYLGGQAGIFLWPAYSNRDQVEADTDPGYAWSVLAGVIVGGDEIVGAMPVLEPVLSERFGLRFEIEVSQRYAAIHGVNAGGLQSTADGETLEVLSGQLNFWPSWEFAPSWHFYAGGGVGVSQLDGLGEDAIVFSYQAGTGVLIDFPWEVVSITMDIGWRSLFASSAQFQNNLLDFDSHGGAIGFLLRF